MLKNVETDEKLSLNSHCVLTKRALNFAQMK